VYEKCSINVHSSGIECIFYFISKKAKLPSQCTKMDIFAHKYLDVGENGKLQSSPKLRLVFT